MQNLPSPYGQVIQHTLKRKLAINFRKRYYKTAGSVLKYLLHSFGQIHIFVRSRGLLSHHMHQNKTSSGPTTKQFIDCLLLVQLYFTALCCLFGKICYIQTY